jgi:hypothetical protein
MRRYVFATSNTPSLSVPTSITDLVDGGYEWFSVCLDSDEQFHVLMNLLWLTHVTETQLTSNQDFSALYDYSSSQLPHYLSQNDFDVFFDEWLIKSGRQSSMDEYGQLIFLWGRAADWNKNANRFVLRERASPLSALT